MERAGLIPFVGYGVEMGSKVDSANLKKYGNFYWDASKSLSKNRLTKLFYSKIWGIKDLPGLSPISSNENELLDYSGGPGSILGIGRTQIKKYKPSPHQDATNEHKPIFTELAKTPPQIIDTSIYSRLRVPDEAFSIVDFRKLKYEDKGIASQVSDYQQRDLATYRNQTREQNFRTGNPGKLNLKLLPYHAYGGLDGGTIDQINHLNIVSLKRNGDKEFNDPAYKDLINFRIEAIDSNNPTASDMMVFRAFLDTFTDNYTAGWNKYKYSGRAESFYTYNTFDRKISFSFKIAAQTRWEMRPLYRN